MAEEHNRDLARFEDAEAFRDRSMRSKEKLRKRLAALSFSEKIKILDKLRDREKAIAAAGLRRKPTLEP